MALELQAKKIPEKTASSARKSLPKLGGDKLRARDRMFFTEQLALLLETGVTLHASLKALKEQSDNQAMRKMIDSMMADIAEGKSFSHALARHPAMFSGTYVNLIAASESGGFMDEVLAQLLKMEEKREELRSSLISTFSYPAFLIAFSIAVVVFVLLVVFPKFGAMFAAIADQLPASTKILMLVSDILRHYWVWVISAAAGTALLMRQWLTSGAGQKTMDRLKLRLPVVRDIFVQLYLLQSLRVMSMSLDNGVTVMDTLNACKDVVKNSQFRGFIARVENAVQEGSGITPAFKEADFIPNIVTQMIATGEETGNLPKVMGRLADFYERELVKKLKTFSKMAEPVMLVVMGLIVGILVSSLILPIFKLSRAVS